MCVSGSVATLYASWLPSEMVAITCADPATPAADGDADGGAAAVSAPASARLPAAGRKDRLTRGRSNQACSLPIATSQLAGSAEHISGERLASPRPGAHTRIGVL